MNAYSRRDFLKLGAGAGALALLPSRLTAADVAAPAAPLPPGFGVQKFNVGDWEALSVSDGRLSFPGVHDILATDVDKETMNLALTREFMSTTNFEANVNVPVFRTPSGLVMIDTGAGPLMGPGGGHLLRNLAAAGIAPGDIAAIFISHAHGDHFGGLVDAATGKPAFPNATVYISKTEYDFWSARPLNLSGLPERSAGWKQFADGNAATVAKVFENVGLKMQKVMPGDRIADGFELLAAPGHTPGHLNFLIGTGDDRLLHGVDTMHVLVQAAHPDWAVTFDADEALGRVTRRKLLDRLAADRTRAFFYHIGRPGFGHIRREGAGYAWVAAQ